MQDVKCPECGGGMQIRQSNKWKYPDGKPKKFYGCWRWPECSGIVPCDPWGKPDAHVMAQDKATRDARLRCKDEFNKLWQGAEKLYSIDPTDKRGMSYVVRVARTRAYRWLAEALGIDGLQCHVGMFDVETCERAAALCAGITPAVIREWAHARKKESPNGKGKEVSQGYTRRNPNLAGGLEPRRA